MSGHQDNDIEFKKDWLPIWCKTCNQQGYIFLDDANKSYFVICKGCDSEYSQVWCPECGMGGDFVRNISKHPTSWKCSNCKNEYPLSPLIYKNPIHLYLEDMLSDEILDHIETSGQSKKSLPFGKKIIYFFGFISIIAPLLGLLFIPLVVVDNFLELLNITSSVPTTCIWLFIWIPTWFYLYNKAFNYLMMHLNKWAYDNYE